MAYPKGIRPHYGGLQVRFQHQGRPYQRTLELPSSAAGIAAASRYLEAWKAHVKHGAPHPDGDDTDEHTPPGELRFDALAQDYLDKADIRRSSRDTYRDLLNIYWLPHIGADVASRITAKRLKQVDRDTRWPSKGLRKNAITALRQVFEHGIDEEEFSENPASALRVKKIQRDKEPDPYTEDERARILAWAAATYAPDSAPRLAVEIAFGTGMRTGEILALRAPDWDGTSFRVRRSRVRGQIEDVKTSKPRRVLCDARLRALIDERCAEIRARTANLPEPDPKRPETWDDWILTTSTGEPYAYPGKAFRGYRAAVEACGIRMRPPPYAWRHTYASIGLSTPGVTAEWLANQLGHSLSMFETIYATWIESKSDELQMKRLERRWLESWPKVGREGRGGRSQKVKTP